MNYKIDYYYVDVFFEEEKIYLEYDGSGHKLSVENGEMTQDEFYKKEAIRRFYLKDKGLKEIRILNPKERKLPPDEQLLKIKQFCFNFLNIAGNEWIIIDLESKIIWTQDKNINLKDIY